jgi:hypothetical protein
MPLEWTHEKCGKSMCTGTTECAGFPTVRDRITMAKAAYEEYAESDGTSVIDFALDVLLFAQWVHQSDKAHLSRLAKQAAREWVKRKDLAFHGRHRRSR